MNAHAHICFNLIVQVFGCGMAPKEGLKNTRVLHQRWRVVRGGIVHHLVGTVARVVVATVMGCDCDCGWCTYKYERPGSLSWSCAWVVILHLDRILN